MNLISGTHHSCERKEYAFMVRIFVLVALTRGLKVIVNIIFMRNIKKKKTINCFFFFINLKKKKKNSKPKP